MGTPDEKRDFTRAETHVAAEIQLEDGRCIGGEIEDVSIKGVLIACDEEVAAGSRCSVRLDLRAGSAEIRVKANGAVKRATDAGLAVEFDSVDSDGFEHLRNLVLYNAQDTEQVEEEFEGSVGIKKTAEEF